MEEKLVCIDLSINHKVLPKKLSYYQRNKDKYKKGGKYYKYIPKDLQNRDLKFKVERGSFLISFE